MAIVMRQWMLGRKASCEALAQNPRKNKFLQVNLPSGRGGVGLRPPPPGGGSSLTKGHGVKLEQPHAKSGDLPIRGVDAGCPPFLRQKA
jgi:hypothetical protein